MSSPSANLKKVKRRPLPLTRGVPYRQDLSSLDTSTGSFHKQVLESIRHETVSSTGPTVPKDADLVTSMATRLTVVERELLAAKREIIEKDNYIRNLEQQLSFLKTASHSHDDLQKQCQALQQQIHEMEEFLNDYGMIWVGSNGSSESNEVWKPETSIPQELNFDLIISNIQNLNTIAGEGCAQVVHTPNRAELKVPDPIPLTLYANGLLMFDGPFRPYSDPSTKQFVRDLCDGYFPSELQQRYPDGVPFKISDKRSENYQELSHHTGTTGLFPGEGKKLNNSRTPNPHSKPLSVKQFLSRIPKNVIKGGRVINIHDGLTETLTGSMDTHTHQVTLVDTSIIEEIKQRLEYDKKDRPPTPCNITTLRVKSETGEETYVLKMHYTDTIGDIHKYVDKLRHNCNKEYVIKGAFPPRTFAAMDSTLFDCGLFPSANLFLANDRIN